VSRSGLTPLKLAAHCCVEDSVEAEFLLAEFRRKILTHLKKCGLSEGTGLACGSCSTQKACLTMAYCRQCDKNFCASPRPDDNSGYLGAKCFETHAHSCVGAVPKFPQMRCADFDWSELGADGKMRDSNVKIVRKVLVQKLKLDGKWLKQYRQWKRDELLVKVLEVVRLSQR
jgi:hypothetical protein